jgi:hypothetical protein
MPASSIGRRGWRVSTNATTDPRHLLDGGRFRRQIPANPARGQGPRPAATRRIARVRTVTCPDKPARSAIEYSSMLGGTRPYPRPTRANAYAPRRRRSSSGQSWIVANVRIGAAHVPALASLVVGCVDDAERLFAVVRGDAIGNARQRGSAATSATGMSSPTPRGRVQAPSCRDLRLRRRSVGSPTYHWRSR